MNLQRTMLGDIQKHYIITKLNKLQNYRNGEQIGGCQVLRKAGNRSEGSVAIMGPFSLKADTPCTEQNWLGCHLQYFQYMFVLL